LRVRKEIGKIDPAEQHADGRHQDIRHQALNDCAEGAADNDADRHVNHIAPHGEFLEFLEHVLFLRQVLMSCAKHMSSDRGRWPFPVIMMVTP
jgi:hypothetical protein